MYQFGVKILSEGRSDVYSGGYTYVGLCNQSEYAIALYNEDGVVCDAQISIDGLDVGTWAIDNNFETIIERPANSNRKFTFVKETSNIARRTGVNIGSDDNGIITVTFKPKVGQFGIIRESCKTYGCTDRANAVVAPSPMRSTVPTSTMISRTMSTKRTSSNEESSEVPTSGTMSTRMVPTSATMSTRMVPTSGITVLGDTSDQTFRNVDSLYDIDYDNVITVEIRLVVNCQQDYTSLRSLHRTPRVEDSRF